MRKTMIAILAAMILFPAVCHAQAAPGKCAGAPIYIALLDNKAVVGPDKYWGDSSSFSLITTYILAYKLMWATKGPVVVLNVPGSSLISVGKVDTAALQKAGGSADACYLVTGEITLAEIKTKKMGLMMNGAKKKYKISTAAKLSLIEISTGEARLSDTFSGYHETSVLQAEDERNLDKRPGFADDPVEAGGQALGIPFSRMFNAFANRTVAVLGGK